MQQTFNRAESKSKAQSWLVLLDYLFYLLLVAFLAGFALYLYSNRDIIIIDFPTLLQGAGATIVISLISMVLAAAFGFIGAMGRLSRFAVFRWIAAVYVEVIRGTPILVQLFLWGFGISALLVQVGFNPHDIAYQFMTVLQSNSLVPSEFIFNAAFYGILGLSFNYGAYLTEVFRTGIESVPRGQTEAALSLGLNSGQGLRRIVLPQAFRITIPPFTNYFITLVQDSALLSTIGGVIELQQLTTALASPLSSEPNKQLFVYIFGALIFLAICYPLALLARYLEARMALAY
ncbi:MAG TPA: amino acid ABC transporter permease [Ktedonobacter sp.]|jgi:His/Glu/Gln/Arg/opine family amino acid ABC transporter permease subunit|nr:amino acid ABC transporter permease [Ktedonobacter sp.]HAT44009.1 amino acid ABC transporter permease [Ktedonobacter sp.]HCF87135.1 amino acid ABC transporter permease [Ktedonobacter sp.]